MYMCIYSHIHMCMYVCMYTHTYTEAVLLGEKWKSPDKWHNERSKEKMIQLLDFGFYTNTGIREGSQSRR